MKNKAEVWRAKSTLKGFRQQARILLGTPEDEESKKEAKDLLDKLNRLGIMKSDSLEEVLALEVEDILDRRLQTLVHKQGKGNTPKHARQLIVHGHVRVGGKVVDVPRYFVPRQEEDTINVILNVKEA